MKLTNSEKLIVWMLTDISETIGIPSDFGIDPKFVRAAITSDNTWGIEWKYPGIFSDRAEPTPPQVTEVLNYLDMWEFLELSYSDLKVSEKERVATDSTPFGTRVQFRGFDGNNESEYMSIARFLIEELDRYTHFKGRDLNSHMPTVATYARMYKVFEPIRRTLGTRQLTASELTEVLKAMRHPGNR